MVLWLLFQPLCSNKMKFLGIIGSTIGIALSLYAIDNIGPTSNMAFAGLGIWTGLPFLVTLYLSFTHRNKIGVCIGIYVSLLIGILLFVNISYRHPDPQGGIAFLALPIIFSVVILFSVILIKVKNT